jgi:chromosome segregation ATPase
METPNSKHGMLSSKEDLVELVLELQEENQRLSQQIEKLQERPSRPGKDPRSSSEAPSIDQKAQRAKGAEGRGNASNFSRKALEKDTPHPSRLGAVCF